MIDTGLLTAPAGSRHGAGDAARRAGSTDRYGGGPLALFGVVADDDRDGPVRADRRAHLDLYLSSAMFFRGVGMGFAFMPAMTAAFASLERCELSDATPQLNVLKRVGGSIGVAVLAVILQRALDGAHTPSAAASAYGTAFWAATVLSALAIVPCIVLWLAERRARTPHPGQEALDGAALSEAVA